MKRYLYFILTGIICLGVFGCGSKNEIITTAPDKIIEDLEEEFDTWFEVYKEGEESEFIEGLLEYYYGSEDLGTIRMEYFDGEAAAINFLSEDLEATDKVARYLIKKYKIDLDIGKLGNESKSIEGETYTFLYSPKDEESEYYFFYIQNLDVSQKRDEKYEESK